MPQKKRRRNLCLLYYFVIERNIRMQTTRLRAIITVRIMAPHPQTIKITQIAAHPLLLQQLPLKILPHPLQKKFAKVLLDNYMIVKVKRQKVWLSARGNLEMIYCPTLQRLKVRPEARFSKAPLRLRCRVNLKHAVRKKNLAERQMSMKF